MGTKRGKDVERARLEAENASLRRRLEELSRRVAELEGIIQKLGGAAGTERLDQPYSMKAEEQRQGEQDGSKRRKKQQSERRGRVTTQEKLDRADQIQLVLPDGWAIEDCRLVSRRPVWRIENGVAVLVASEFYTARGTE